MKPSLPRTPVRLSLVTLGALSLLASVSGASVRLDEESWHSDPWNPADQRAIRYSYLEGSYLLSDVGDFSDEAGGWQIAASIDVAESFRLFASLDNSELDEMGAKIDETNFVFGFGYHTPIATNLDLTADLMYLEEDTRRKVGQGLGIDVGVRWRPTQRLELSAGGIYHLYDEIDSTSEDADAFGFRGEGHLWLQDSLSLFARIESVSGDIDSNDSADRENLSIGLRFAF